MVDFLSRFSDPEFIRERISMCVRSVHFPSIVKDWEAMRYRLYRMCWLIEVRWPRSAEELWKAIEDPECKRYCKRVKDEIVEKHKLDQERWFGGKKTVKPPTEGQVKFLRSLGHTGAVPGSSFEASRLIDRLKKAA